MAPERPERPPWIGPPSREIGVPIAFAETLLEGDDVLVALVGARLHSCGAALVVETLWRDADEAVRAVDEPMFLAAEDGLRFGVELGDGRGASSRSPRPARDAVPPGPVLLARGGLGFPQRSSLWLWPMPADSFVLHAAWPAFGLAGRASLDAFGWPAFAGDVLVPG